MKLFKVLVLTSILLVGACGRLGDAGYYAIQANNLSDEALQLEEIVKKAPVTEEDRLQLIQAVGSVKMLVSEVREFDGLEDFTKTDLYKMHRIYRELKDDIRYIATVIMREDIWSSYNYYEQTQLSRFYSDARNLSKQIDEFIEDPYNTDYLKTAAKISAYGSIVARIIFSVYKYQGIDFD